MREENMKVLLLDDHPLVRSALESVIRSLGREITVFSVAKIDQANACLGESGPIDLALLDLQLPDGDGFSVLAEWRQEYPDMSVVIISASEQADHVMRALDQGAVGFIPKRTTNEVLMHALKMVMSGGVYVPPMALTVGRLSGATGAAGGITRTIRVHEPSGSDSPLGRYADHCVPLRTDPFRTDQTASPSAAGTRGHAGVAAVPGLRLTPRQSEVLELLLQGQPNKLIARHLNLSVETVKDHVASLLRVLGVSSRTQAVLAVGQMLGTAVSPAMPMGRTPPPASRVGLI
jgi:DNA-binding NarL/FixJ family response regulator